MMSRQSLNKNHPIYLSLEMCPEATDQTIHRIN